MMKKRTCFSIFLCGLLVVLLFSARDGFCYAFKGFVYVDVDEDGRVDKGEGVEGITVTVSSADGSSGATFTTGPNGYWKARTGNGPLKSGSGTYTVKITLPEGYAFDPDQTVPLGSEEDGNTILVPFNPATRNSGKFRPGENTLNVQVIATPLPATAWFLVSGLLGLVVIRTRRKSFRHKNPYTVTQ